MIPITIFKKRTETKPKTAKVLFNDFCNKFTTDDLRESAELQVLYNYLFLEAKRIPDKIIRANEPYADLLKRHMNYHFKERRA